MVLPNNQYLVLRIWHQQDASVSSHAMPLSQFTPRQPLPDVYFTLRDWKFDPEVIFKHDDLYARACAYDYETPFFATDDHNTAPTDPPKITVRPDLPPQETWNPQGTSRECSPKIFPSADGLEYGTDRYQYTQHVAEMDMERHHPFPTNARSSKYCLHHNPKPKCNDDYTY